MDREQAEMQLMGLCGIYKEGYKLIISWKKIFSQITLALILPLSLIYLAHEQVSSLLFTRIIDDTINLDDISTGTPQHDRLSRRLSSTWTFYWLFKLFYFTFLLVFSLLSTAAIVYTVASVYTRRDVSFRKIMSVVPKVWKRLMVTFLCTFATFFAYNAAMVAFLVAWFYLLVPTKAGIPMLVIVLILYVIGLVYITIIWQLASVISVLEDYRGFRAMKKSKQLMKGKFWLGLAIVITPALALLGVQVAFQILVVQLGFLGVAGRVAFAVLCLLPLLVLILFALVIQTVLYFVCKSYHREVIDKSALSDHLDVLGDYERLRGARDVQLEQLHV